MTRYVNIFLIDVSVVVYDSSVVVLGIRESLGESQVFSLVAPRANDLPRSHPRMKACFAPMHGSMNGE